jgi:hypothetical protein
MRSGRRRPLDVNPAGREALVFRQREEIEDGANEMT